MNTKRRPRPATLTNDDFFSYLAKYKVIKVPDHGVEGGDTDESDTDMIGATDDVTNLVQQYTEDTNN